jgi:predicted nuclease of predicted toxin-antitoxin system
MMRVLLDENVPVDILPVLRAAGIEAESVNFIGWKRIQNGELITRARSQFNLLLTRDKDFDEDYLKKQMTPTFGIVLLAIPQQPGPAYATAFSHVWPTDFNSLVGKVTRLPS